MIRPHLFFLFFFFPFFDVGIHPPAPPPPPLRYFSFVPSRRGVEEKALKVNE